jgi:ribosomal-protein-alanine N-acetyltransferase
MSHLAGGEELVFERLDAEADVEPIVEIERESFSTPWTADMFRWELRNRDVSATYVARVPGGRVAAFCCIWVVLDELHINNIAVARRARRQGLARRLLGHVIQEAVERGAMRATLEVRRSNQAALRLYERMGFHLAGVRPNYYSNPVEDALILWRSIGQTTKPPVPSGG